jgi:hypothetical protein
MYVHQSRATWSLLAAVCLFLVRPVARTAAGRSGDDAGSRRCRSARAHASHRDGALRPFHVRSSDGNVECWGATAPGAGPRNVQETELSARRRRGWSRVSGATADRAGSSITLCDSVAGGTVKCWGSSAFGALGNGTVGPDRRRRFRSTRANLSGVVSIAAGGTSHCAVLADGTVQCLGRQEQRRSGLFAGNFDERLEPSCDAVSEQRCPRSRSAAITRARDLKDPGRCLLGRNNAGQLGDGTTNDSVTSVTVPGVTSRGARRRHRAYLHLAKQHERPLLGRQLTRQSRRRKRPQSLTPVFAQGLSQVHRSPRARPPSTRARCAQFGNIACWGRQ